MSVITDEKGVRPSRKRRRIIRLLLVAVAIVLLYCSPDAWRVIQDLRRPAPPPLNRSFDGNSTQLAHTQIVPTLDTAVDKGKNVIWCASFELAWKRLQADVAKEPVRLSPGDDIATRLNQATDSLPDLPAADCYAAAGAVKAGVVQRIQTEMKSRFPSVATPTFEGLASDGHVAYAFLQTQSHFRIPYFQNRKPLEFKDSAGKKTSIRSFGIRTEDEYAYNELRDQVGILFRADDEDYQVEEFAIDLCRDSQPYQVVAARIALGSTLAETLTSLQTRISEWKPSYEDQKYLGVRDTVLVPDIFWRIEHHFRELEGSRFLNDSLKDQLLEQAVQEIVFRLDRNGAELRSEAKEYCRPVAQHFDLNGPFLLYMKKRDAGGPFFVMWIDNAELLQSWPESN
jgi:hypothetical protein